MQDAITLAVIFLGISSMVAIPLAVLIGLPLAAWLGRGFLRLKERELDIQRLEVVAKLRESAMLPMYVDKDDPEAVMAWVRADRELARLTDKAVAAE